MGILGLAFVLVDWHIQERATVELKFDEDGVDAFLGKRQLCFIPWEQFRTAGIVTTRVACNAYLSFLTKEELQMLVAHPIPGKDYAINEWLRRIDWIGEVNTSPLFVVPNTFNMEDGKRVLTQLMAPRGKYIRRHGGKPLATYCFRLGKFGVWN